MNIECVKQYQDNRTIIQEGDFFVTNLSFENQTKIDNKSMIPKIESKQPLTIDLISRGYGLTEKELESITKINLNEILLLEKDPTIEPNDSNNTSYYILVDGTIVKCVDDYEYYGLDLETMEWKNNQIFMHLFYNSNINYSELLNFRDYYSKKEILKSQMRTF